MTRSAKRAAGASEARPCATNQSGKLAATPPRRPQHTRATAPREAPQTLHRVPFSALEYPAHASALPVVPSRSRSKGGKDVPHQKSSPPPPRPNSFASEPRASPSKPFLAAATNVRRSSRARSRRLEQYGKPSSQPPRYQTNASACKRHLGDKSKSGAELAFAFIQKRTFTPKVAPLPG